MKQLIEALYSLIIKQGGFTFNTRNHTELTGSYYIVSLSGREAQVELNDEQTVKEAIERYINLNSSLLLDFNNYLGAWTHEGVLYLDISEAIHQRYKTLGTVKELARERKQVAIWDLFNNCEIPV